MKYTIKNRWTMTAQCEVEIECSADASEGMKLGLAVRVALKLDANLASAYLAGANLADANLSRAKWRDGITITRAPLQLYGLAYTVTILDAHMQVGCELHTFDEWDGFDDERISRMDGVNARRFWRDHKVALMLLCRSREVKAESKEEEAA